MKHPIFGSNNRFPLVVHASLRLRSGQAGIDQIPLIPPFSKGEVRTLVKNFLAAGMFVVTLVGGTPALLAHEPRAAAIPSDHQPAVLKTVQLAPRLGAQWPVDVMLRDEAGAAVSLGGFITGKPTLLLFSYFNCSMLCPVLLEGVSRSLKALSLNVGRDFVVIVISIDPRDGPAEARKKKQEYVVRQQRGAGTSGWHFLTADAVAIERITRVAGFSYSYDEMTGQYAHAAALFVLTAQAKLARVLHGVEPAARDLRLALVEASDGRIGTAVDQLLLYCYHYDPMTGRYGSIIMNALRITGLITVLLLAGWISFMLLSERPTARQKPAGV
jgi:protein SCO1